MKGIDTDNFNGFSIGYCYFILAMFFAICFGMMLKASQQKLLKDAVIDRLIMKPFKNINEQVHA